MQRSRYCTVALLVILISAAPALGVAAAGQDPAAPPPAAAPAVSPAQSAAGAAIEGEAEFTLFLSGRHVGTEQVRVARAGSGRIISSTGQFGPPLNLTLSRFELRYTADWQPT